jgi:hypothetical protein
MYAKSLAPAEPARSAAEIKTSFDRAIANVLLTLGDPDSTLGSIAAALASVSGNVRELSRSGVQQAGEPNGYILKRVAGLPMHYLRQLAAAVGDDTIESALEKRPEKLGSMEQFVLHAIKSALHEVIRTRAAPEVCGVLSEALDEIRRGKASAPIADLRFARDLGASLIRHLPQPYQPGTRSRLPAAGAIELVCASRSGDSARSSEPPRSALAAQHRRQDFTVQPTGGKDRYHDAAGHR